MDTVQAISHIVLPVRVISTLGLDLVSSIFSEGIRVVSVKLVSVKIGELYANHGIR